MEFNLILKDDEKIKQYSTWENSEEIQIFREYLRIPSVHPNIDYSMYIFIFFSKIYIKHSESDDVTDCDYINL